MATAWRVRPQPCTTCGEKVLFVETHLSALGGLLRRTPAVQVQHADYEPVPGQVDHVDDECRRGTSGRAYGGHEH